MTTDSKEKLIKARTIVNSIIPAGRVVELKDIGNGVFLVVRAERKNGKIGATAPMTLFLRVGQFERIA